MDSKDITVIVQRFDASTQKKRIVQYTISREGQRTVLDLLETIRTKHDASLNYRHSCHHGSCGTCAVVINGEPRLACTTPLPPTEVTISAIGHGPPRSDLVVDTNDFFDSFPVDTSNLRAIEPPIAGGGATVTTAAAVADIAVAETAQTGVFAAVADIAVADITEAADIAVADVTSADNSIEALDHDGPMMRFEDCIECGICVSACPVDDFLGPAALAAVHRALRNEPARSPELESRARQPNAVERCKRIFACSRSCPTGVAPGRKISELRRQILANPVL